MFVQDHDLFGVLGPVADRLRDCGCVRRFDHDGSGIGFLHDIRVGPEETGCPRGH